ncbi:glucan endo-1,3-beta-glucosidase btgC like protein [Zymoseptoria brevis]|uniref:glucan endo-1,3-beta-D-glucosidase n=1 Tax=Zymoseptoria brevis TaxID=1047168 RepID=A0A0F4GG70_9PEZI|nr:glucan endo-1,3-beta-glucosidase btgC like protein [Zymoseptoria brevis]
MSGREYGIPAGHIYGEPQRSQPQEQSYGYTDGYPHDRQPSPPQGPYHSEPNDYGMPAGGIPMTDPYDNQRPPMPPQHQSSFSQPSPAYRSAYSQSSLAPLTANQGLGQSTPSLSSQPYGASMPRNSYYGDGYDDFDPNSIADDGDDDLEHRPSKRGSRLGLVGAAGGAAAGAGMFKSMHANSAQPTGGSYGPVGQSAADKSEWLRKQSTGRKRLKWWVGGLVAFLVVAAIAGGVVGGILGSRSSSGGGNSPSAGRHDGILDKNSAEIKALMNDDKLHKVFPAVDYTPYNAQYPACEIPMGGPDQNNVTIDIALLSQLAPSVRLYGTDCNQTELVLEAIKLLDIQQTMKVWIGVYLDGNQTTNDRQISKMYDLLDNYPHDSFAGIIVGNEVLYAKYLTATELGTQLESVRDNLISKGISLPVATADLGDNWDATLAAQSDIVMANIHPFFAGTVAEDSASWAYTFWTGKDVPLKTQKTDSVGGITYPTQIIAEIGWPTQGGNDCGDATSPTYGCTSDTDGAVASIDNLNTFMDGWVCGALANGTTFFWFEAFDEPWKHQFDTKANGWEPFWGIFDKDRNFKKGVTIPDCGGKTVEKAY